VDPKPDRQRGAASVEHAALVLLMALVACAVVALFAVGRGDGQATLASAIAFKQRCAVRYPQPCWQDPLTEAYGRELAGAVRALAPAPRTVEGLVGVDYRRCRQASCAVPGPQPAHLTTSNRRTTAFTSVREGTGGSVEIDYWIYRPTIGWEQVSQFVDSADVARYAKTPLLDSADPVLVPLETLLGRDDASFPAGEEPPWRGQIESLWGH
jgi:Flp pilus assembly pilin Flp